MKKKIKTLTICMLCLILSNVVFAEDSHLINALTARNLGNVLLKAANPDHVRAVDRVKLYPQMAIAAYLKALLELELRKISKQN